MGVRNFAKAVDVGSWEQKYAVTTGASDLSIVFPLKQGTVEVVIAFYAGSGAITLVNYKGFPVGSIIHDQQAHKDHEKTAAAGTDGWVSSAART